MLLSQPHLVLSKSSLPRGVTEHGNSWGIPGRQPGGGGGRDLQGPQPPLLGIQRRASPVPGWGPRNPPSLPPGGPQVVAHLGPMIPAMRKPGLRPESHLSLQEGLAEAPVALGALLGGQWPPSGLCWRTAGEKALLCPEGRLGEVETSLNAVRSGRAQSGFLLGAAVSHPTSCSAPASHLDPALDSYLLPKSIASEFGWPRAHCTAWTVSSASFTQGPSFAGRAPALLCAAQARIPAHTRPCGLGKVTQPQRSQLPCLSDRETGSRGG